MARKYLSNANAKDYEFFPEFKKFFVHSKAAVKIIVDLFRKVLDEACEQKTAAAFAPFLYTSKTDLFSIASRLLDTGFYDEDAMNNDVPCLKAIICMQADVDKLLITTAGTIEGMPQLDAFEFHRQLKSATWIKDEIRHYMQDD